MIGNHHSIGDKPIDADFSKGYTKNWSKEIFIIDSVLKTNPWTYTIKHLNGEKIIRHFYEKELLRSKL